MDKPVQVEVVGLKDISCSPFPCDHTRSCGLYDCYPSGKLLVAFDALKKEIHAEYEGRVEMKLTLIDDGVPPHIEKIIEKHYPPLPIFLVNGEYVPMGRISLPMLQKELERVFREG